jgi:hypothetical protein
MSLSVNVNLALSKGNLSETFAATQTASVSATGYDVQVPSLGTASTLLSTATLSALGYSFMRSLVTTTQSTCTITFGRLDGTTMHDMVKLRPGEIATMRLASGSYAAKAADSGYRFLFAVIEE